MDKSEFEFLAERAPDSFFAFAEFTRQTENLFEATTQIHARIEFKSAWSEMAVVHATAQEEWFADKQPGDFEVKWRRKFQKHAVETVGMVREAAQAIFE